ncbi:WxL domain-containing protein [Carnobacterium gallinarum]|uniref:WxL domain-containing protein n=1 Tax=Carnobacterium gallinarum TaxID=2749 RepID=UPI00055296FB|nr:WxL domain-containing protein [Carnobacterium gallinarum]
MKVTKKSLISLVSLATFTIGGTPTLAATVGTATPEGSVTFGERTDGGDGNVTLPGTGEPGEVVRPVDPTPSPAGPLMITNAPKFDFGTVEIKSTDATYPVKASEYFTTVNNVPTTAKVYKSPMVQIEDVRSEVDSQTWSLAVSATPFTAGGAELAGAEIRIGQKSVVFNNTLAAADQKNPAGITTTAGGYTIKPTAQTVLSSAAGKGNGKTTLVLDNNYREGGYDDGSGTTSQYTADSKIDDVQLYVPITASKSKGQIYTSTISWIVSDTPEAINATN